MIDDVYTFTGDKYVSDPDVLEILGTRGKRVFELASINAPIAPGFIFSSDCLDKIAADLSFARKVYGKALSEMETIMGKKFNSPERPLVIKVVESPTLNLVNTLSTVHNIGIGEVTSAGFGHYVGLDFAYREYANMIQRLHKLELLDDTLLSSRRKALEIAVDDLEGCSDKISVEAAIAKHRDLMPEEVYTDMHAQLLYVIQLFHNQFKQSASSGNSCLLVQAMVFGNYGQDSGFGNFHTHHIISGQSGIQGEYFKEAFDARSGTPISLTDIDGELYRELQRIGDELEQNFKEIRHVRFTVENGKLWIIDQIPVINKSTQAEIKTLLDLQKSGAVDKEYVVTEIKPGRLSEILHSTLDISSVAKFRRASGGIAGAVGAAVGRVFFDTERLIAAHKRTQQEGRAAECILAMPATFAEDVKAIEVGQGVISSEGGYASHAPVVARSLGKVALVYPKIKFGDKWMEINGTRVNEGDYITLNVPYYDEPIVYFGQAQLTQPTPEDSGLLELLNIIQEFIGHFDVRANADQPRDAKLSRAFGAKGIGLCRTEHMFFHEDRIQRFRSMIIAGSREERLKALKELGVFQANDFYQLFKIMKGLPVTIRLLDAPLHEFLPHTVDSMNEFVAYFQKQHPNVPREDIVSDCDLLREFNPMLGHRGVRVAISYPEIYNMQVRAIFEAAYRLQAEGVQVIPEIMVPIVMTANELKAIRNGKRIEGKSITGIRDIELEIRSAMRADHPIEYQVGTMIELPAAALQADRISRYADFFSFGTNDLTQTTNGLSRDDFNNFFSDYNQFDLLVENPFQVLGEQVKEIISIAAERGRLTRPNLKLGLCGEHGAEPATIPFACQIGLDYVSCSPYGIPIAKLAIAQMNIELNKANK